MTVSATLYFHSTTFWRKYCSFTPLHLLDNFRYQLLADAGCNRAKLAHLEIDLFHQLSIKKKRKEKKERKKEREKIEINTDHEIQRNTEYWGQYLVRSIIGGPQYCQEITWSGALELLISLVNACFYLRKL